MKRYSKDGGTEECKMKEFWEDDDQSLRCTYNNTLIDTSVVEVEWYEIRLIRVKICEMNSIPIPNFDV